MDPLTGPAAILFWSCLALVAYAYVGYPAAIWALARTFGRDREPPAVADDELPATTLILAAYNEEEVIAARLHNALEMDYPPGKLEVVVGSDGSVDRTVEIVRSFAGRGVRLIDEARNRGKASVINAAVARAGGAVVLMSDANTCVDPGAARRLARWFADPTVGAVVGRLVLVDRRSGRNADGLYWRYETFLKRCESRLGALLGANGAIYAIRKELIPTIPPGTIVDDFVIPLLAKLESGCAIVYEPAAVAVEETAPDVRSEFRRRVRIGAGGFQSIGMLWRLLAPRHGWTAFAFLSHKILRWLGPFFLIGALAANLLLLGGFAYRMALVAQLGFYATAAAMALLPAGPRIVRPLRLTTMFAGMNAALLIGFCRWASGRQGGAWQRTPRGGEVGGAA
jgi:cellulose synthase/poly-beta-1,6-N-acetylglucosamine synthase-like glycosyltransferase